MAPSNSLVQNPHFLFRFVILVSILGFALSIIGLVVVGRIQNKEMVAYELTTIIKGNRGLILANDYRNIINSLQSDSTSDIFMRISSHRSKEIFYFGDPNLAFVGVCANSKVYAQNFTLCRSSKIPSKFLFFNLVLYIFFILLVLKLIHKIEKEMLFSFKKLFESAQINFDKNITYSKAWIKASQMADDLREFKTRLENEERGKAFVEIALQVAHDIRSPISVLNIISSKIERLDTETDELLKNCIKRINDIANDLLIRKKSIGSSIPLMPAQTDSKNILSQVAFDLTDVIKSIVNEKRAISGFRKITLSFSGDSYNVIGDRGKFERILSNLIQNSIDATANVDQSIIELAISTNSSSVSLGIIDNGIGVPEEILEKLNSQIPVSYGKQGGNGIGVLNARATILDWGGTFQVYSKFNQGTMVHINLPKG